MTKNGPWLSIENFYLSDKTIAVQKALLALPGLKNIPLFLL